jgi:methionyl-tRNA formyltransferase
VDISALRNACFAPIRADPAIGVHRSRRFGSVSLARRWRWSDLRIVLIGQAAFAERALEMLTARGEQLIHVFAPPDAAAGKPDPLKAKALELGLPLSQPASFRSDTAFEHFNSLGADLAVMAFVTIIVPERILYAPRHKSICFHPSLLPRHRGASAIAWTLIHGDGETGVTWFWPDKGIDTGPILVERRAPVGPNETTGSLYFNTLFPLGIEALGEAIELIESGRAPHILQDEALATYEPICRDEHAQIDFAKPGREVHNLIRGCDPQPGAYAKAGERRLRLYEPIIGEAEPRHAPGTIIAIDASGMRLALREASVTIKRVRLEPSTRKAAPAELAASGELRPGDRLA